MRRLRLAHFLIGVIKLSNIIREEHKNEYIEKYNEASECLKTLLWDYIFLTHSKNFLNSIIPLSTKPIIEKLHNDVNFAFHIRMKSLSNEKNNILKNLENTIKNLYVKENHKKNFINSLKNLSWNSPKIINVRNRFANETYSVQDAEILIKASYEYLKKLAVDDISPVDYTQYRTNCEWFAGYFFELNDKHSSPLSITF